MRGRSDAIFENIKLPTWNLDRFYGLFIAIREGRANRFDQDDFARMLMYQIKIVARKEGWRRTFDHYRIEPEDAAATVLSRLNQKVPRMNLKHPCPRVLIAMVLTTIGREFIGVQRSATQVTKMPSAQPPEHWDRTAVAATPDVNTVADAIADAEPRVCGLSETLQIVWRFLSHAMMSGVQPTFAEAHAAMGDTMGLSADAFAYTSYHLRKTAAQAAADVGAFAT